MHKLLCACFISAIAFGGEGAVSGGKVALTSAPLPPFVGDFHQWQKVFLQWGLKEGPYSSVEASVDPRSNSPIIDFGVQERESGKRIQFVTNQALLEEYKSVGVESYLSNVQMKKSTNPEGFDTYEFALRDHQERPIVFRFVQATPPSEKGAGLSEIPGAKPMIMMYRLGGSVAAQGTAVQIGKLVLQADVWQEISQPPYFIAYKGAMTEGSLSGELGIGVAEWTVQSAPKSFEPGESWKLKDQYGRVQDLKISSVQGGDGVFTLSGDVYGRYQAIAEIQASVSDGRWLVHQVRYCDEAQGMTVKFDPGLYLTGAGDPNSVKFQIVMAKNQKIAEGTIDASLSDRAGPDRTAKDFTWRFRAPTWAKKKVLVETTRTTATGYRVEATAATEAH